MEEKVKVTYNGRMYEATKRDNIYSLHTKVGDATIHHLHYFTSMH